MAGGSSLPLRRRHRALLVVLVVLFILALVAGILYRNGQESQLHNQTNTDTSAGHPCGSFPSENSTGIGAVTLDGERVGVSDGTIPLDIRNNGYISFKCLGTSEFLVCQQRQSQLPDCDKSWGDFSTEISHISDDAESLIYRQNAYLFARGDFSHTIIVGVSLSNDNSTSSRYLLQGVYAAQEEYNRTHLNKLRVLVANFGDTIDTATQTMQQIVRVISADRNASNSIVGIVNIPFIATAEADQSQSFHAALEQLATLNIPIVSPNGMSGSQSEQILASTMFHIGVPAWREGSADAIFARQYLSTSNVVVYTDTRDSYSDNLAASFLAKMQPGLSLSTCSQQLLNQQVHCVNYTVGDANTLTTSVANAMGFNPGLIYFAGNAVDARTLMTALMVNPQFQQNQGIRILGSDALYQGQFTQQEYERMAFSAFAFPDEWPIQGQLQSPFVDEYGLDFQGWPPYLTYGFVRPNSTATLAYDATKVFTQSIEIASNSEQNPNITANTVFSVVRQNGFQGFSGYIYFDTQGNPINKALVFLIIGNAGSDVGKANMQGMVLGCFLSPVQERSCPQY